LGILACASYTNRTVAARRIGLRLYLIDGICTLVAIVHGRRRTFRRSRNSLASPFLAFSSFVVRIVGWAREALGSRGEWGVLASSGRIITRVGGAIIVVVAGGITGTGLGQRSPDIAYLLLFLLRGEVIDTCIGADAVRVNAEPCQYNGVIFVLEEESVRDFEVREGNTIRTVSSNGITGRA
jgi:hypothetical protein